MSPGSRTLLLAIDDGKLTCFAWQSACFDFEFLKRIRKRKRQTDVRAGIKVCSPIEEIVRCIILPAGNRKGSHRRIIQIGGESTSSIWHSGAKQGDQLSHISSI